MVKSNFPEFSSAMYYLEQHEKHNSFPSWVIRHQKEVFHLAYQMGQMLRFKSEELTDLAVAARFHDIGKSHIDPSIINHRGPLTEMQKFEVFQHVHQSYDILRKKGVVSKTILEGVFYHHENYNGTGYPDRLKEDEIPIQAQILRIVDSFSAMLGSRPYHERGKHDLDWAILQIENNNGTLYNPDLVKVFLKIAEKLRADFKEENNQSRLYTLLFDN